MAKIQLIRDKKYNSVSVWVGGDYSVTIACDDIVRDGPMTSVKWQGFIVMTTSNDTEILEKVQ